MSKETKAERAKRNIELELDRQLADTFPASDPLEITRRPPEGGSRGNKPEDDRPDVDQTEK